MPSSPVGPTRRAPSGRRHTPRSGASLFPRLRWWHELALLAALYALYSLTRNAAPTQVDLAQSNATWILDVERMMGIDVERGINGFVAPIAALAVPANYYYATLHFAVTGSVLVWLYRRRPSAYGQARSILLGMTLLALVGYWLYPLAPPRLMPGSEFVDTVRVWGTWGVAPSDAVSSASNQYAAMPSMHVGWALWSGVVLASLARRTVVRVLGAAYPALTLLVVVATGNHFLLDALGAVVVFVAAVVVVRRVATMRPRSASRSPVELPTSRVSPEVTLEPTPPEHCPATPAPNPPRPSAAGATQPQLAPASRPSSSPASSSASSPTHAPARRHTGAG